MLFLAVFVALKFPRFSEVCDCYFNLTVVVYLLFVPFLGGFDCLHENTRTRSNTEQSHLCFLFINCVSGCTLFFVEQLFHLRQYLPDGRQSTIITLHPPARETDMLSNLQFGFFNAADNGVGGNQLYGTGSLGYHS